MQNFQRNSNNPSQILSIPEEEKKEEKIPEIFSLKQAILLVDKQVPRPQQSLWRFDNRDLSISEGVYDYDITPLDIDEVNQH